MSLRLLICCWLKIIIFKKYFYYIYLKYSKKNIFFDLVYAKKGKSKTLQQILNTQKISFKLTKKKLQKIIK